MKERRSEKRYLVPEVNRKYVKMEVQASGAYIQAGLIDYSRRGLKFIGPEKIEPGALLNCRLSIPSSMSQVVRLRVAIRYMSEVDGEYLMGGEIIEVDDAIWLEMFKHIHDFISERLDEVY